MPHRTLSLLGGAALLLTALSPVAAAEPPAMQTSNAVVGQYIVVLRPGADRAAMIRQVHTAGGEVTAEYRHALSGFAARLPEVARTMLARNANVQFVAEDTEVAAAKQAPAPTSPCLSTPCLPTGIDRIDADLSSARSGDGTGSIPINIAVLDSGSGLIEPSLAPDGHPDLNVVGGFNCLSKDRAAYQDTAGHGTHVAGTIGARDNGFGVVGVVPDARMWSVRVLNKNGSASVSRIICGIDWVTSTRTDASSTNDITVANMSLGGKGADDGDCGFTNRDAMHVAICNSVAAGVTYVVAAGNDSADFGGYIPAAYDEVLTTTAIADYDGAAGNVSGSTPCVAGAGQDDSAATFSNYASSAADRAHTIAAPGTCILSTWPYRIYVSASGTSMAAPHVAGVVALCIASGPCAGLSPSQVVAKIVSDAAAHNAANPGYGFAGDPSRPAADKHYGHLVYAGMY